MQSYLQLAYQLATRNSQCDSQLARLTYFSYSISSPIRRISFQKSFQKNNGLYFSKGTPQSTPYGALWGYPRFYNYPFLIKSFTMISVSSHVFSLSLPSSTPSILMLFRLLWFSKYSFWSSRRSMSSLHSSISLHSSNNLLSSLLAFFFS